MKNSNDDNGKGFMAFMFFVRWRLIWFLLMAVAAYIGLFQRQSVPLDDRATIFICGGFAIVGLVGFIMPIYFKFGGR